MKHKEGMGGGNVTWKQNKHNSNIPSWKRQQFLYTCTLLIENRKSIRPGKKTAWKR